MYLFGGDGCALALHALATPLAQPTTKATRGLIVHSTRLQWRCEGFSSAERSPLDQSDWKSQHNRDPGDPKKSGEPHYAS